MDHLKLVVPSLLLATALCGCHTLKTDATKAFADKYSCPDTRITTTERSNIEPSQILLDRYEPATPPAEVAADPGRLAKWRSDQQKRRQQGIDSYDHRSSASLTVYELKGCGHHKFVACRYGPGSYGSCQFGHPPLPLGAI